MSSHELQNNIQSLYSSQSYNFFPPKNPREIFLNQWCSINQKNHSDFERATSWDLQKLPNFNELIHIEKAVDRIILAIQNNENIGIYGDYDVDGTTSCALMYRFFKKLGHNVKIYQPSRFIEGYGLHISSVEQAYQDGIHVLITVDCGSSSLMAAEKSLELGIDLIITDHHKDAAPTMPNCFAFINPNRRDEITGPLQALAGVGVAFALCVCVRQKLIQIFNQDISSLYDLLPYVAIGTISDLAPLNEVNLVLCRHGFKALEKTQDAGLRRFIFDKPVSSQFIESEIISFFIGPMINSKGRLDHPEIALQLLIESDQNKVETYFHTLLNTNSERKLIQKKVFEEAKLQAIKELSTTPNTPILVLKNLSWHEGVIGIVASKLVEEFQLPTLVFTSVEGSTSIKASARTANGIDIFETLKNYSNYFEKFGGHKAAAGLTMKDADFLTFKNQIIDSLYSIQNIPSNENSNAPLYHIDFNSIDGSLLEEIYKLAPFGQGNPMPIWKILNAKIESYEILKDGHVSWKFSSKDQSNPSFTRNLKGISFNYLKKQTVQELNNLLNSNHDIIILAQIKVNQFRGKNYLNLQVDLVQVSPVSE